MSTTLSIGDFSVITHLSIKTLRYYHRVGLLEPAEVDPHTGYRRYQVEHPNSTNYPAVSGSGHASR